MTKPNVTVTTRAASRGELPTIYAKKYVYYNSFLPKTVRELKSKLGSWDQLQIIQLHLTEPSRNEAQNFLQAG